MVKLVGAVCILGAGTWAWRRSAAERRRELDTLADLTALLDRMGEEIRAPPDQPAPAAGVPGPGPDGTCPGLLYIGGGVAGAGRAPGAELAVRRGGAAPRSGGAGPPSTALGDSLQGDEESVCKALTLAGRILEKNLAAARDHRQETEKRSAALWLSSAALLVILLI